MQIWQIYFTIWKNTFWGVNTFFALGAKLSRTWRGFRRWLHDQSVGRSRPASDTVELQLTIFTHQLFQDPIFFNFDNCQYLQIRLQQRIFLYQLCQDSISNFYIFYVWNFNFPYFHIYFNFPKLKHILSKRRRNWLAFRNIQEDLPLEIIFWSIFLQCLEDCNCNWLFQPNWNVYKTRQDYGFSNCHWWPRSNNAKCDICENWLGWLYWAALRGRREAIREK